jgi:hypothetical protein
MATFDEIRANPVHAALLKEAQSQGGYKVERRGGRWGVEFMGTFYTDMYELETARSKLGVKTQHVITSDFVESLPGSSFWKYTREQSIARGFASGSYKGHRIEVVRTSLDSSKIDIDALAKLIANGGKQIGILTGDKETTVLTQVYKINLATGKREQLFSEDIEAEARRLGLFDLTSGVNAIEARAEAGAKTPAEAVRAAQMAKDRAFVKLQKRKKVISNLDEFAMDNSDKIKALVFTNYAEMYGMMTGQSMDGITREVAERMVEGKSVLNPRVIANMQKAMEDDLLQMEIFLGRTDITEAARRQTERDLRKLDEAIGRLKSLRKNGGVLEGFRMGGFDWEWAQRAGLDEETFEMIRNGIIKGDVHVIGEKQWKATASHMAGILGNTVDEVLGADIIAPAASFAKEASIRGVSFHITHMKAGVPIDQQLLAVAGDEVFDAAHGFGAFTQYNLEAFKGSMKTLLETGELPKAYKAHMRRILDVDSNDPTMIRSIIGSESIPELRKQQERARRILTSLEMGINPANDEAMLRDVAGGMIDFLRKSTVGSKADDLFGLIPYSIQGHATTDFFTRLIGGRGVAKGSFGISQEYGTIYNALDWANGLAATHGGADLDDLMASLLYRDGDNLVSLTKRSPLGVGELSLSTLDDKSYWDVADLLTSGDEIVAQNQGLRAALEAATFVGDDGRPVLGFAKASRTSALNLSVIGSILREHAPEMTPALKQRLQTIARLGDHPAQVPFAIQVLNSETYSDVLQRARALMPYLPEPQDIDVTEILAKYPNLSEEMQASIAYTARQGGHTLERYSLVREMSDQMAILLENLGAPVPKGILTPFEMEPIIDLIAQGQAKGYEALLPKDVELATQALERGMVRAALIVRQTMGINILDPGRLTGDGRNSASIANMERHLKAMQGEFSLAGVGGIDELLMSPEDPRSINAQSKLAQERMLFEAQKYVDEAAAGMEKSDPFRRTFFDDQAIEDADMMKQAFDDAMAMANAERTGILPNHMQKELFGKTVVDVEDDLFKRSFARDEMRRAFVSTFEDGKMTRRALHAMGAFMQRYGDEFAASDLGNTAAYWKARAYFELRTPSPSGKRSSLRRLAGQKITSDDILGDISPGFVTEGMQSRGARAAAYDVAKDVAAGIRGRGPQGRTISDLVTKMWDVPSFRKGSIAAAGLIGASLLYRKTKDRSVDDFQGPPLLPGGSFYEDMPSPDMPQQDPHSVVNNGGGVIYKVNARGGFSSDRFRAAAETITGTRASGSVYSALPRKRQDPREAFGR